MTQSGGLLALALLVVASCSAASETDGDRGRTAPVTASNVCRSDARPNGCPSSWEEAQAQPACGSLGLVKLGHAGSFLASDENGGFGGATCLYGPSPGELGGHLLVGMSVSSDIPVFCDFTAFAETWGELADGPFVNDLGAPPSCARDGGLDDASAP